MVHRVVDLHRSRLKHIQEEVEGLAGAFTHIANQCQEVLDNGGTLQIQPQLHYAWGAIARLLKDCGVIEQLQGDGVAAKKVLKRIK